MLKVFTSILFAFDLFFDISTICVCFTASIESYVLISICNYNNWQGKRRKRARMAKKAAPAKKPEKAVKVSTVMDTKNVS